MTIQFYLDNENETHIHTMFNMSSNPFKVNETINLTVDDIPPVKLKNLDRELAKQLLKTNKEERVMFHNKAIRLVREGKYIDIESNQFIIEYHCKLVS